MKRFICLLCVLLAPLLLGAGPFVRTNGEPQVQGPMRVYEGLIENINGLDTRPATRTVGNLNLYVRTTGADTNDCLSAGAACLTIQEAIDRIPTDIDHAVVVDIGEGSFAAFNVNGLNIGIAGTLDINGTLGLATGLTGLNAGNLEGAGGPDYHSSSTDNEGGWVADELVGKLFAWAGGYYRPIITNTATVVEYIGPNSTGAGAYTIEEQKTIITGDGILNYAGVEITNVTNLWPANLEIRNLKHTSGTAMGFLFYAASGVFIQCYAAGEYWGFTLGQSPRVARTVDCFAGPCGIGGYFFQASGGVYLEDPALERCVAVGGSTASGFIFQQSVQIKAEYLFAGDWDEGLLVESVLQANVEYAEFDGNDDWGVLIDRFVSGNASAGSNVWLAQCDMDDNTTGIRIANESNVFLDGVGGTGNSQFGVTMYTGATLKRDSSALTLTGASGDLDMDGGAFFTWATHLNSFGDTIVNTDNGCRAEYE